MNSELISQFQLTILEWFVHNQRIFPWRVPNLSDYQLIIAEILLQRTKAETVSKFYNSFINRYSGWNDLVETDIHEIETFLKPVGLYTQRAKRIKSLALEMQRRNRIVPTNREELSSIPFFGQYIANSIELLILNKPSPLLDVNMSRVLERYFGPRNMADIRYDPYLQDLAYKIVNHKESKQINWAILDYSALICKARNPLCEQCIFKQDCHFYQSIAPIENKFG